MRSRTDGLARRVYPGFWQAILTAPGLTAEVDLDNDPILFAMPTLREYFAQLGADWRGWSGVRTWGGGALAFAARQDGLGHVTLTVELQRDLYDSWTVSVPFVLDAGALTGLSREVASFTQGLEFGADQRQRPASPPSAIITDRLSATDPW